MSQIENILAQILNAITNLNPTNSPLSSFGGGGSMGSILARDYMDQQRAKEVSQIVDTQLNQIGRTIFVNGKKALGYNDEAIKDLLEKNATGTQTELAATRAMAEMVAGQGIRVFAGSVYDRKDVFGKRGESYLRTYQKAAKEITNAHAWDELEGYDLNEAFTLAGKKVSEGSYDFIDPDRRGDKIVKDLQDMAEGVIKLKDGLKGSMGEVLDAFENLTGTAATLMSTARFNALARKLSESVRFNGTSLQAISGAAQLNQSYMEGTGASQTFSASSGINLANIQAKGLTIEGATLQGVADEVNRITRTSYTSGETLEYAGAYSYWLSTTGREHTEENRRIFNQEVGMRADGKSSDPRAIQAYIQRKGIGEYVTGTAAAKMRDTLGNTVALENEANYYRTVYNGAVKDGVLTWARQEDIALSDEQFREALLDRGAQQFEDRDGKRYESWEGLVAAYNKGDLKAKGHMEEIVKTVDKTVGVRRTLVGAENFDNYLQMINNFLAVRNTSEEPRKVEDFFTRLAGAEESKGGITGVLQEFTKRGGPQNVASMLRNFMGIKLNADQEKALEEFHRLSTGGELTVEDLSEWEKANYNKLTTEAERKEYLRESKEYRLQDLTSRIFNITDPDGRAPDVGSQEYNDNMASVQKKAAEVSRAFKQDKHGALDILTKMSAGKVTSTPMYDPYTGAPIETEQGTQDKDLGLVTDYLLESAQEEEDFKALEKKEAKKENLTAEESARLTKYRSEQHKKDKVAKKEKAKKAVERIMAGNKYNLTDEEEYQLFAAVNGDKVEDKNSPIRNFKAKHLAMAGTQQDVADTNKALTEWAAIADTSSFEYAEASKTLVQQLVENKKNATGKTSKEAVKHYTMEAKREVASLRAQMEAKNGQQGSNNLLQMIHDVLVQIRDAG